VQSVQEGRNKTLVSSYIAKKFHIRTFVFLFKFVH